MSKCLICIQGSCFTLKMPEKEEILLRLTSESFQKNLKAQKNQNKIAKYILLGMQPSIFFFSILSKI